MSIIDFINTYKIGIVIFLFIASLLFIMCGHVYREKIQLILKRELVKFPESSIDWWSTSHFLLFSICGFIFPEYPLTFFGIGVGFELFEDYLSSDKNTMLANCKNNRKNKVWCKGIQDGYWYMNPTDPWVNLTGYILGSAIRTTMF